MRRVSGVGLAAGFILLSAAGTTIALAQSARGDPVKGAAIFDDRCSLCHQIKDDGQGPRLGGVVGRKAASVPGVDYTDALKKLGVTWTPDKLDLFLSDPAKMAPGTAMPISVPDAAERRDLIAYLATTSAGGR